MWEGIFLNIYPPYLYKMSHYKSCQYNLRGNASSVTKQNQQNCLFLFYEQNPDFIVLSMANKQKMKALYVNKLITKSK